MHVRLLWFSRSLMLVFSCTQSESCVGPMFPDCISVCCLSFFFRMVRGRGTKRRASAGDADQPDGAPSKWDRLSEDQEAMQTLRQSIMDEVRATMGLQPVTHQGLGSVSGHTTQLVSDTNATVSLTQTGPPPLSGPHHGHQSLPLTIQQSDPGIASITSYARHLTTPVPGPSQDSAGGPTLQPPPYSQNWHPQYTAPDAGQLQTQTWPQQYTPPVAGQLHTPSPIVPPPFGYASASTSVPLVGPFTPIAPLRAGGHHCHPAATYTPTAAAHAQGTPTAAAYHQGSGCGPSNSLASPFTAMPISGPDAFNSTLLTLIGKNDTFNQPASSIDQGVPDRLRLEIWADKFVDFNELLKADTPYAETGIAKLSRSRPQKIKSFMTWSQAFYVFHAVYLQAHPTSGPSLIQYIENIRHLSQRFPDAFVWRDYDERFRYKRQSSAAAWDVIDTDLWLKCTTNVQQQSHGSYQKPPSTAQSFHSPQKRSGGQRNQAFKQCAAKGYCYNFQFDRCSGDCKFKHLCRLCDKAHPASQCSKSSFGSNRPSGRPRYSNKGAHAGSSPQA